MLRAYQRRRELLVRIGAHVSTSGGLPNGIERAQNIGAEAIQIFGAAPQSWRRRVYTPAEGEAFRAAAQAADVWPVFIHGVYLVNLGTSTPGHLDKSVEALIADMRLSSVIGCKGVIFHVGSHRGAGLLHLGRSRRPDRARADQTPDDVADPGEQRRHGAPSAQVQRAGGDREGGWAARG
jgi:sugar phosphate isomerase/epimerase